MPDAGVVVDYNRFLYARGNPLRYADPSGHCPWCIVGAVAGGVVGGGFELGRQMLNEDKAWADVDWRRVGVSSVGGAVAAGTMGLASTAGIGAIALWGAGSSVLGGQAAAVTDGAYEYFESGSTQQALNQALSSGFLDPETIIWDAGTGAITGVASAGVSRVLQEIFPVLQGSPNEIVLRDPVKMMRFDLKLDSKGVWVFRNEGRELTVEASGLERLVRSSAQGAAATVEEVVQNLVEEGIARWRHDD